MFSYINCYDEIINGTITNNKVCYTCNIFCEFSIFVLFLTITTCCLNCFCRKKKNKYKEIMIQPSSPPPYS